MSTSLFLRSPWQCVRQRVSASTCRSDSVSRGFSRNLSSEKVRNSVFHHNAAEFNDKLYWGHSISEIAGNLSFVCAIGAFSLTDILGLRLLTITSQGLAIFFQYYRSAPLWIPIRWNIILVVINATMATQLWLEREKANRMTRPLNELYHRALFEKRGFNRVEFLRLMSFASVVESKRGHVIAKEGEPKKGLYLLVSGRVAVMKGNRRIATLAPYHFIGEMSLLGQLAKDEDIAATADVVVDRSGATFYYWEFSSLVPFLEEDREVKNALSAYFNYDLRAKLIKGGQLRRTTLVSEVPE